MTDQCNNCRFYKAGRLVSKNGACLRYPPVNMILPNGKGGAEMHSMHAAVGPEDWCGEHKPTRMPARSEGITAHKSEAVVE